jgi:flagellar hook-associated protein 3 FlgL
MIRQLDSQSERFLDDLRRTQQRADRAQREISSGRRLNAVSDDPGQVAKLIEARAELRRAEQARASLGLVKGEVDTAEAVLREAVSALDRIQVLGAQGANTNMSADNRRTIAGQVSSLLAQLVDATRTSVAGRYLFSGDADGAAAYTFDPLQQPYPVSAYQGTASTREILHPSGTRLAVARTAQQIFDDADPARNVFQTVNNLRLALEADDTAAIAAAMAELKTASAHLNNELAFYGAVQSQVDQAVSFAGAQQLRLRTQISGIEDADVTGAILELQQARFQQESSLSARAHAGRRSLFDYLG